MNEVNVCSVAEAAKALQDYNIIFNTDGEVPIIELPGMKRNELIHGFTTRLGGVSKGIYESLNLGTRLDDDHEDVMENYRRLGRSLGIDETGISFPNQVHGTRILVVRNEMHDGKTDATTGGINGGVTAESFGGITDATRDGIDAQITDVPGIPLIVFGADCVPILFYDPVNKAIGSAHAGWRGAVNGIASKVVRAMGDEFGTHPSDLIVGIGPSIGQENYEVDRVVIDEVDKCLGTVAETSGIYIRRDRPDGEERYMLNLWELNKAVLTSAGVPADSINIAGICTMKHHDIFFSHRYTSGRRGLNAGIICLPTSV